MDMDDILSGKEEPPQVIEEAQPEQEAQPRDEIGRFAPKGEEGASPVPAEDPKPELEHPALLGERRRRQEAEARIAALEAQISPPPPAPSVFEDETGFADHLTNTATQQAVQAATMNARLDMSEMLVRQANPDFETVKAEFLALADANPALYAQCRDDPHPWNKAYQIAKNHKAMTELGAVDVADLEAKIRAKVLAEIQPSAAPTIPETLAGAGSGRTGSVPPHVPPTLNQILGRT